MLKRWSEFRRRQREVLRLSNSQNAGDLTIEGDGTPDPDLRSDSVPLGTDAPRSPGRRDYGPVGRHLDRQAPFSVGFVGTLGVLDAYGLHRAQRPLTHVSTPPTRASAPTFALHPRAAP